MSEKKLFEPLPESPAVMMFAINERQYEKFKIWYKDVQKRAAKKQWEEAKARNFEDIFDDLIEEDAEYPYTGAIGGGLTWEFTPTSLGEIVKVRYYNGEVIDLSEYENW